MEEVKTAFGFFENISTSLHEQSFSFGSFMVSEFDCGLTLFVGFFLASWILSILVSIGKAGDK